MVVRWAGRAGKSTTHAPSHVLAADCVAGHPVKDLWFLAISSGKGGLDGWRMMAIDDTGTDLWTVAWAWEELEGSGVAV